MLRSVSGACEFDDSSEEVLVDQAVDSTATGKHDLENGIVAVRNDSSVQFSVGRALDSSVTGTCDLDGVPVDLASSPATAGDGNLSRLLEVIESAFPSFRHSCREFASFIFESVITCTCTRAFVCCCICDSAWFSLCVSCDACVG